MTPERFVAGKRFNWQGSPFEVRRVLPGNELNIENISSGAVQIVELSRLVDALFRGELEFEVRGRHARHGDLNGLITESERIALDDYPARGVEIARRRLTVIAPLLEMDAKQRTRAAVTAYVEDLRNRTEDGDRSWRKAVSVSSVYRWMRDYSQSGSDLRALIPKADSCGNPGKSRLDSESQAIVEAAINTLYWSRENVTIDDITDEVILRIHEENQIRHSDDQLKPPSRATIFRRIEALDMRDRFAAKQGARAAKQKFSQYGRLDRPSMPLDVVEIDHTIVDVIVIDEKYNLPLGRPTLAIAFDIATRYPTGYYIGFDPPSYLTVAECLYFAIRPKGDTRERFGTEHEWLACGLPRVLKIDNGKEFANRHLEDSCEQLGITLERGPVKVPQLRAFVERNFRSLNTQLFHKLRGTTFSNPKERSDYDSEGKACITLRELETFLVRFLVDIYAQQPHRGLKGVPARRWEQAVRDGFNPNVPQNAKEMKILLGQVEERVIHHYGIQFMQLYYNSPALASLRTRLQGSPVKFKFHPSDLSVIHVFDPYEKKYVDVGALDVKYTEDLSLWQHRTILQDLRDHDMKVDRATLAKAKRRLREDAARIEKRTRLRKRSSGARWEGQGSHHTKRDHQSGTEPGLDGGSPNPTQHDSESALAWRLSDDVLQETGAGVDEDWEISFDLPRSRSGSALSTKESEE